jgi:RimJ/RimL family protein N-acetyltransferase
MMDCLEIVRSTKATCQDPKHYIEIGTPEGVKGYLRPVRTRTEDATKMAKWRTEHYDRFFTWVRPSVNDMLNWLVHYENRDNDILFILEAPAGISVGQMALHNIDPYKEEADFGRVIRGEKKGKRGIMVLAAAALLEWAISCLELKTISLQTFADNEPAVSLYKDLGFRISNCCLFRRTKTREGIVRWVETKKSTGTLLRKGLYREVFEMTLGRADLRICSK